MQILHPKIVDFTFISSQVKVSAKFLQNSSVKIRSQKLDLDLNSVDTSFNTKWHTSNLADILQVAFKDENITHKIFDEMKILGVL